MKLSMFKLLGIFILFTAFEVHAQNLTGPFAKGGTTNLNTASLIETLPNDTSTGSSNNKLVIYTSSAKVKTATTTDTNDVIGICVSGITGTTCSTSGNASVAIAGQANCVFDGATTAGDFMVASTTVAGDCHDAGSAVPSQVQVIGYVLSTNGVAGTYSVDISNVGMMGAIGAQLVNVAYLNVNQSFTKGQAPAPVALTDASPIAVDASTGNIFTVTLNHATATRQLANPTNLKSGQVLTFVESQDSTGGAAQTYGSFYKWAGGTAPTLTSTASAKDVITCQADTSSTLVCTSLLNMQ